MDYWLDLDYPKSTYPEGWKYVKITRRFYRVNLLSNPSIFHDALNGACA
jgi:hypothetical protein